MIKYLEKILNGLQGKTTKIYLILASIILAVFPIWFSNVGLLPFSNLGDFLFFAFLGLIFAIYRPGWAFVFLIGSVGLENINIASQNISLAIRPYQFLAALTVVALIVRIVMKKITFSFPKFRWYDALPIVFVLGGFLSSFFAENKILSFKQSVVALSFVVLYFLARIYIQSFDDFKRIAPFFMGGGIIVAFYAILQNIIFINGGNSFEVMPGRPNATFTEPDWLGIFLVFLIAAIISLIYFLNKKTISPPEADQPWAGKKFLMTNDKIKTYIIHSTLYMLLGLVFVALILTVSRSAWLGAAFVIVGFLKIMLTNGSLKVSEWNWKNFIYSLTGIIITVVISIGIVYIFNLSRFQIFNRAASTGGLQKITIACLSQGLVVPEKIGNISELEQYGCRHINLEDIERERYLGFEIREIYRTDPNVNIRAGIYKKSIEQIKQHPILGIGWGSISDILGKDERGAGLNASNIFLEVWLGAGLLGILSFTILIFYVFIKSAADFLSRKNENKTIPAFIMLGWAAIIIPNLFNSGIFLGFVWIYLGLATSLLSEDKSRNN